jgi:hypothetical protein
MTNREKADLTFLDESFSKKKLFQINLEIKMAKHVIFLLMCLIVWTEASSLNEKPNHKNSKRQIESLLQANSGISRLGRLNPMSKAYELLVNRRNELKKQEKERKKEVSLREKESMRRRIYEQYLLSTQGGSNVLKDFHTIRF